MKNNYRSKKNKPSAPAKPFIRSIEYVSECCNTAAKKEPCERSKDDRKEGKLSQAGLGKWHCSVCRKTCKVSRRKIEAVSEPKDEYTEHTES